MIQSIKYDFDNLFEFLFYLKNNLGIIHYQPKKNLYCLGWDAWKSRDDENGMFCHSCGKGAKTNLSKPLCQECS